MISAEIFAMPWLIIYAKFGEDTLSKQNYGIQVFDRLFNEFFGVRNDASDNNLCQVWRR